MALRLSEKPYRGNVLHRGAELTTKIDSCFEDEEAKTALLKALTGFVRATRVRNVYDVRFRREPSTGALQWVSGVGYSKPKKSADPLLSVEKHGVAVVVFEGSRVMLMQHGGSYGLPGMLLQPNLAAYASVFSCLKDQAGLYLLDMHTHPLGTFECPIFTPSGLEEVTCEVFTGKVFGGTL
jgi:hypothetical protein